MEARPNILSSLCGWLYFLAWSASFYAQPLLNLRRRSTYGLLIDYPLLNVCGFTCYTVSISVLLLSPTVKAQYATRHPSHPHPTVQWIDLAYALHALVLSGVTLSQFQPRLWGWKVVEGIKHHESNNARPTRIVFFELAGAGLAIMISIAAVFVANGNGEEHPRWQWLDVITALSMLKVLLTITKYVPQALSHIRERSTFGFSIMQVLLDIAGGIFSLAQLLLDSYSSGDGWSGVAMAMADNPGKLGLAIVSLAFDGLFVLQHYVFYGPVCLPRQQSDINGDDEERRSLLGRDCDQIDGQVSSCGPRPGCEDET